MKNRLTFRPATRIDSDMLADLVMGDPEQESTRVAMRLYGLDRLEDARKIFRSAWRAGENWRTTTVGLTGNDVVGLLQTDRSSVRVSVELVLLLLSTLGPLRTLRLPGRLRLQRLVSPKKPPGAFVVSELHVAARMRGHGYGEEMLVLAEQQAREHGSDRLALHTLTTNPAQRLYQRFGFEIVETLTNPDFQKITGADGNVLMIKRLDVDAE